MNNSIRLLVLLLMTLFSSCSNDEGNSASNVNNQGFLKIGSQSVELSQGYLENFGVRGNAYNIDLSLKSKSISGTEDGAVVYFELFSSLQNNLSKGDYSMGGYSEATAYTFTKWGQSLLGKNINAEKGSMLVTNGVSIRPSSGTFKVIENGETYKVSFTGKGTADYYKDGVLASSQNDVTFTMQYQGDVKRSEGKNFTAKKSSSQARLEKDHAIIFK